MAELSVEGLKALMIGRLRQVLLPDLFVIVCGNCGKVLNREGKWRTVLGSDLFFYKENSSITIIDGTCPDC